MPRKREKAPVRTSPGARGPRTGKRETKDERDEIDSAWAQLLDSTATDALVEGMDPDQRTYYEKMLRGPIRQAYVDEPAGTGKTTAAFVAGLQHLRAGKLGKLLYIRFPSKRGNKLGFVPGELAAKEDLYFDPAYQALEKCGIQREAVSSLIERGVFSFQTDVRLRGTTLDDAFIIVDEAQNAQDIPELELVLGRFTDNVRAAIIGDSRQCDSNVRLYGRERLNAFQVYTRHMTKQKWAERFRLSHNYRGVMAKYAAAVDETVKELEDE